MDILDVAPVGVYPPKSGGHKRIHYLNLEASKHGHNIFLFAQGIRRFEVALWMKSWITNINDDYLEYRYVNIISIIVNVLTAKLGFPALFTGNMLNVLRPSVINKQLKRSDVIKVEHPWQFTYISKLNTKYKRPIVLVEHNLEYELAKQIMKLRVISEVLLRYSVSVERNALESATAVFTTSDEDKHKLITDYGLREKDVYVVPNGVDTSGFTVHSKEEKIQEKLKYGLEGKKVIIFSGSRHSPNNTAVQEIFRMSEELEDNDVLFLIVGAVGDPYKNNKKKNVLITGYVNDVMPYFKMSDIAVNPMCAGSGTNIKMLEYLASGLPTITSPVGARGLKLVDGVHTIISDIKGFPSRIQELLGDEEKQKQLSNNGLELVEKQYDWKKIAVEELAILDKLTR